METRWRRVGKCRWNFRVTRGPGFFRSWGFALLTDGGCYGSTSGEPGRDMSRCFHLTLIRWTFTVTFCWKSYR